MVDPPYNGFLKCGANAVYATPTVLGRHVIFELQDGKPYLLDDEEFIKDALRKAAKVAGATLLSITSHKFEPQGVTALALLSESHLSIHTWPEIGYAAIDAFTCGDHTDPEAACRSLKDSLEATRGKMKLIRRESSAVNHDQLLGAVP